MHFSKKAVAAVATLSLLGASIPLPAQAALVGTEQVLHADSSARQHIRSWLARQDVRKVLLANGVDPAQVQARVNALTDHEAQDFAQRIDQLPAGGGVLEILFAVFVILLITDILGLTKVFPFTRSLHH